MMRDNVGTLQFHSYSTYRHAMVLIVRAWIGDILLGYRRLFLLVSVKRAIGLLSVWDACVSQRLVPAAIFTSSLSVSFSSRARNLYSQPCTSHLSPSPPPSLATTSSIPLFFPHSFSFQKHTHLLSYLLFQGDYIFNPQCKGVHVHGHHFCSFASIQLYSGQSPPPIYQLRFVNSGTMMGLQNHH